MKSTERESGYLILWNQFRRNPPLLSFRGSNTKAIFDYFESDKSDDEELTILDLLDKQPRDLQTRGYDETYKLMFGQSKYCELLLSCFLNIEWLLDRIELTNFIHVSAGWLFLHTAEYMLWVII